VAHCGDAQLPFIIGGDFNLPPEELHHKLCETPLLHQELQLMAPPECTCTTAHGDSTLDYWLLGGGAQLYAQAVAVDHTVPITPHSAVALHFRTGGGKMPMGQVWRRPGKGSATQVVGPQREIEIDWAPFDTSAAELADVIKHTHTLTIFSQQTPIPPWTRHSTRHGNAFSKPILLKHSRDLCWTTQRESPSR
jgi:hypothetical protein